MFETARECGFRRFRLRVTRGPDKDMEYESAAEEATIGTAQSCDLPLTDPTVSRHHCVIAATKEGFLLRDLGSTNGTVLGGYRINSAYVKPGAIIRLGQTAIRFDTLDQEVREPISGADRFGTILGVSRAMRRIFTLLPKIASSDSTALLEGETGTGKGLVAAAIHQASPRSQGPFVVIDCSAIPLSLIESELFGHEKGAFTGAHTARPGAFEAARGGTIFLDEIGELPLEMQPKLLRALEERVIKRIGSVDPIRLDVRMIAATNRDLRVEVNRRRFRSDLFYRLNIVKIRIPPLRERTEDIPLLADHFYAQFTGDPDATAPAGLVDKLLYREWRGNVRELRSAVERAVLMGETPTTETGASIPLVETPRPEPVASLELFDAKVPFRNAKEHVVSAWERAYVSDLIRRHEGNLSRAARAARMDRNYLRELLIRHGVPIREE